MFLNILQCKIIWYWPCTRSLHFISTHLIKISYIKLCNNNETYAYFEETNAKSGGHNEKNRSSRMSLRSTFKSAMMMSRPCHHCKLIESGDVALYQITCPECGEVPPSRKHLFSGINRTDVKWILKMHKLKK